MLYSNSKINIMPLIFLLCSIANSKDFSNGFGIFVHPLTVGAGIYDSRNPGLDLYLTVQVPLDKNGGYSLIANPSILLSNDYFRRGTGIGFRCYIGEDKDNIYLQLMPSAHYLKHSMFGKDNARESVSGKMIDILGYIGSGSKSMFLDIGIGYGWAFFPKGYRAYSNYPYYGKNNHGLAFDINFGFNIFAFFAVLAGG
jgi:hypothetical protein